jgi:hypothetical protein
MSQAVEYLHRQWEVLSLIPKERERERNWEVT